MYSIHYILTSLLPRSITFLKIARSTFLRSLEASFELPMLSQGASLSYMRISKGFNDNQAVPFLVICSCSVVTSFDASPKGLQLEMQ